MEIKKVAVLGAGNGGFMSAVDMSAYHGYEVAIFETVPGKLDDLKKNDAIELLDIDSKSTGVVGHAKACDNIADAVKGADVILNPVPFFAVKTYADLAAPYITEGQVIVCLGKGGASLVWGRGRQPAGGR